MTKCLTIKQTLVAYCTFHLRLWHARCVYVTHTGRCSFGPRIHSSWFRYVGSFGQWWMKRPKGIMIGWLWSNSKRSKKVSAVQGVVCWSVSPCGVVSFSMMVWCVALPCVVLLSVLFGNKHCCNYSTTLRQRGYWQVLLDICIFLIQDTADWGSLRVETW